MSSSKTIYLDNLFVISTRRCTRTPAGTTTGSTGVPAADAREPRRTERGRVRRTAGNRARSRRTSSGRRLTDRRPEICSPSGSFARAAGLVYLSRSMCRRPLINSRRRDKRNGPVVYVRLHPINARRSFHALTVAPTADFDGISKKKIRKKNKYENNGR